MRPTFMGFETSKSAIFANQKSIDIVGNNLANTDTNGYTRQRVERTALAPSSYTTKVASSRVGLIGQGVEATGVSQTRDAFLDKCFRDEYSQTSYHGMASEILTDIQTALGDPQDITDEGGLYSGIAGIYEALNDFVQNPTLDTEANLVMSSFKNMVQVLNQLDTKLAEVAQRQTEDLQINTDHVNDIFQQIAHLNKVISEDVTSLNTETEYYSPNELMDQRNLLIDELSQYGDISVTALSNNVVNVSMGGALAVEGKEFNTLGMTKNEDDTVSVRWRSTGEKIQTTSGSLLASVEYINGRGKNITSSNETSAQGILYYRDRLDTFANTLAKKVNSTIPVLDEATGKPAVDPNTKKVIYKTLLAATMADGKTNSKVPTTAGNISISDEWTTAGAGYFIYDRNDNVEDYAQKLASFLAEENVTFTSVGESFTGSFADYEVDFVGKLGADLAFQNGRQEATALVADSFQESRDEVAGVSQDEETADMIKYQRAFEAAARMMTVLDDLLDVLINRMGRVGL